MFKLFVVIIFLVSMTSLNVEATERTVAEDLSIIDQYNHTAEQFESILDAIHYSHPKYSQQKIGDMLAMAYSKLKGYNLSMYEIANDIRESSRGVTDVELSEIIASYIILKKKGSL